MNSVLPPHPLDHGDVVKIALGPAASAALEALGTYCLVVATKGDSTVPPEHFGKMILLCAPATKQQLEDAFRVLQATHRAVKIKTPTKPSPASK